MKTIIKSNTSKPYPKLMSSEVDGIIILASGEIRINGDTTISGVIICGNKDNNTIKYQCPGYFSEVWSKDYLTDFEGEIILSND